MIGQPTTMASAPGNRLVLPVEDAEAEQPGARIRIDLDLNLGRPLLGADAADQAEGSQPLQRQWRVDGDPGDQQVAAPGLGALGEQVGNGGRFLEVLDLVREQILVDVLVANVLVIALLA